MKRSGKILLEGTIEEFKKHCKGADNREYLLINTKEIKKDGTYTVYQLDNNTERVVSISTKGKYGKKPFIPYDKLYLTFIALSSGTFVWAANAFNIYGFKISYSKDNGETWSEPEPNITVNVNSGDKVLWKGEMKPITYGSDSMRGIGKFDGSTAFFDVQGNIKSLLYGDEFKNSVLKDDAFPFLFTGTNVVNAKNLILNEASEYCYYSMFNGCANLETAPKLPATTLAIYCYTYMFDGCASLITAPELPATTLTSGCYGDMFRGCSNLNYIKMLATDISANNCLYGWVDGVAETGTMVVNGIDLPVGVSGVPSGWTVQDIHDYSLDYLTFIATSDGTFSWAGQTKGGASNCLISYSLDGGNTWSAPSITVNIEVKTNDKVLWRGDMYPGTGGPTSWYGIGSFGGSASFIAQGNPKSLLYSDNFSNLVLKGTLTFKSLFLETKVVNAANLIMDKILTSSCYDSMFKDCTLLIEPPRLPATTLTTTCYSSMFAGCTSLTKAPDLIAPLVCVVSPAAGLYSTSYNLMFKGCTNLSYVKVLAEGFDMDGYSLGFNSWLLDVAEIGTFVKSPNMTSLPTGVSGIPTGWTVEDATE